MSFRGLALQSRNVPLRICQRRGLTMGESLTAEKMDQCRWVKPSWFARSHSSNGRTPDTCGIAPSSACAMTRRPRRWFAKLELIELETHGRFSFNEYRNKSEHAKRAQHST